MINTDPSTRTPRLGKGTATELYWILNLGTGFQGPLGPVDQDRSDPSTWPSVISGSMNSGLLASGHHFIRVGIW